MSGYSISFAKVNKLINMHVHYKTSVKIEPAKKYQFRQHFETVFPVFKSEIDWT